MEREEAKEEDQGTNKKCKREAMRGERETGRVMASLAG